MGHGWINVECQSNHENILCPKLLLSLVSLAKTVRIWPNFC